MNIDSSDPNSDSDDDTLERRMLEDAMRRREDEWRMHREERRRHREETRGRAEKVKTRLYKSTQNEELRRRRRAEEAKTGVDKSTQTEELHVTKCIEMLMELLQNGQLSDVTLDVKGKEFRAHRKILAAHSPVFAAMMTHDTKEKATGIVDIEDCEPTIFNDFLHFLYSGSLTLNEENVADLYAMADKYLVNEMSRACVEHMKQHISLENFCDIMALSLRHHENELTKVATDYFLQNSIAIMETTKWITFMKENVIAGNELLLKTLTLNTTKSV